MEYSEHLTQEEIDTLAKMRTQQGNLPDGMINMGPAEDLKPEMFDDLPSQKDRPKGPVLAKPPIQWIEDPNGGWAPLFSLEGFGNVESEKMTATRPTKELLAGEKTMIVMAYANSVCEWLFGESMFVEKVEDNKITLSVNPEFNDDPLSD